MIVHLGHCKIFVYNEKQWTQSEFFAISQNLIYWIIRVLKLMPSFENSNTAITINNHLIIIGIIMIINFQRENIFFNII